jgi:hypothetical protein
MKKICALLILAAIGLAAHPSPASSTRVTLPFPDQELNDFLAAKGLIFDRAWVRAVNAFQDYFKAYPAGRYGDEAGYWLAKALDGQAGEERTVERVLDRKTAAVEALARLEKEHPASPWLEEARPFRKKLLGEIALIGGPRKKAILAAFLKEENKTLDQARVDALDALLSWDRGWAAPVIEDLLKTVADPEGRKTAVRFAGRYFFDETGTLLRDAAEKDADAGVRTEASAALERAEMVRLPVDALHFVFSARLTDRAGQAMLPEMTAKVFDLPPAAELNNSVAEEQADDFFGGKLRRLKMGGGGGSLSFDGRERLGRIMDILDGTFGSLRLDRGRSVVVGDVASGLRARSVVSDRLREKFARLGEEGAVKVPLGDVTVAFPFGSIRKTPDSVGGRVVFEFGDKEYPAEFTVDGRRDQLAAFRRGDDVWLVVLQFNPEAWDREGILGLRRRQRSPVVFKNVLGCRVESSRDSWPLEEIAGKGLIDFGKAKAEVPGAGGRWRLEGFLQADTMKKVFIGRNAELFDPSGKSVVRAAELIIPADAPDKYQIVKK